MTEDRAATRDYVLREAREQDIKFVRLWFTDILGNLKGFAIKVDDLEDAIEQGVGFDGSAIEGFARSYENDMRTFPDPSTFTLLPWRPRQNAVARMFCDIRTPSGQPFVGDPRYALKRNLERVAQVSIAREEAVAATILARDRYRRGLVGMITVLETQRREFVAQSELLVVRRALFENRVGLHLALGGGFELETRVPEVEPGVEPEVDDREREGRG